MERQITEENNPITKNIDALDTIDIVKLINDEDHIVAESVQKVLLEIAKAIDIIVDRLSNGGRLLYFGAGTSGRLGVLEASECPPTFGVNNELVQGYIAGGDIALRRSVENAEDNEQLGIDDVNSANVTIKDVVIGIAASGRTPYVLSVLRYAKKTGAATIGLCNVENPKLAVYSDIVISPIVGPEVICGSTRLKSGTSQKMVLNMLSTAAMVRLGKIYGNLMVDMIAVNKKLRERAVRIVMQAANVGDDIAREALENCDGDVKITIVALLCNCTYDEAVSALNKTNGFVAKAVNYINNINKSSDLGRGNAE